MICFITHKYRVRWQVSLYLWYCATLRACIEGNISTKFNRVHTRLRTPRSPIVSSFIDGSTARILRRFDSWLLIGPNYGLGGSLKQESMSINKSPSKAMRSWPLTSGAVANSQMLRHCNKPIWSGRFIHIDGTTSFVLVLCTLPLPFTNDFLLWCCFLSISSLLA